MTPKQLAREDLKGEIHEDRPSVREAEESHRSRRRKVRSLGAAGIVVGVLTVGVGVSLGVSGGDTQGQPASSPPAVDVRAHPDQTPPRELIAAGKTAVSAYYSVKAVKKPNGDGVVTYQWSLLNATTERYEKTDWAQLDVAPGMQTAVVVERDLPVHRVGLLNLATGKVGRWINVDKGVGGVQFSPDGKRLVATTYSLNPDGLFKDASYRLNDTTVPGPKPSRTGFYVIDVASGHANFIARPSKKGEQGVRAGGGRQDFHWSQDGALLWEPWNNKEGRVYFDVSGPGGGLVSR